MDCLRQCGKVICRVDWAREVICRVVVATGRMTSTVAVADKPNAATIPLDFGHYRLCSFHYYSYRSVFNWLTVPECLYVRLWFKREFSEFLKVLKVKIHSC